MATEEKTRFEKRKENTERRDKALLEAYNELYNVQRIRHDDCVLRLAESFFLTEETVNRILTQTK